MEFAEYKYILYSSRINPQVREDGLSDLLQDARRKNYRYGITGIVLIKDGYIYRYIEGAEGFIDALFNDIKAGLHHRNIEVLDIGYNEIRVFPDLVAYPIFEQTPIRHYENYIAQSTNERLRDMLSYYFLEYKADFRELA